MVPVSMDPVPIGSPSFLGARRCSSIVELDADLAVIGVPYTTPHDLAHSRAPSSDAPGTVRRQSLVIAGVLDGYDFEFGGPLLGRGATRIVDCGDVAGLPGRYDLNDAFASAGVRAVLEGGAVPIVLGGDHAATIPTLRAYAGLGPICIVHLGATLDWRRDVDGVRDSMGSTMRRVAELPWVTSMIQIGLRSPGFSRSGDVADAEGFGSVLVRAETVHEIGVRAVLSQLPEAKAYYVSLDAGALDPSIAPGVEIPAFGGLTYFEATNLLKGVAAKGPVAGVDLVGIVPAHDLHERTSLLGARLLLNLVGALAHAGHRRVDREHEVVGMISLERSAFAVSAIDPLHAERGAS